MPEANLQPCACMHRSASSEVCVVENGNEKMQILTVCRENAKQDGASWWQCLPGIRAGTALGGDWFCTCSSSSYLTVSILIVFIVFIVTQNPFLLQPPAFSGVLV